MDRRIIQNTVAFLMRAQLNGQEAETFTECLHALKDEHTRLEIEEARNKRTEENDE